MPTLLDYPTTLSTLQSIGLKSLYYNSGAFGFPPSSPPAYLGWIGPPDPTLRPQMLPLATTVSPPYPATLARLAIQAWLTHLPGPAWLMPMAHWAYELDFGSADWLPALLTELSIDPATLQPLTTGNALAFDPSESPLVERALERLLTHLKMSDFMLAFPPHSVVATVHHHQQLWWASPDAELLGRIRDLTP